MKVQIICEPMDAWQWNGEIVRFLRELREWREWLKEDDLVIHGIFNGHLSITVSGVFMRMQVGDLLVETRRTNYPTSIKHYPSSSVGKTIKIIEE